MNMTDSQPCGAKAYLRGNEKVLALALAGSERLLDSGTDLLLVAVDPSAVKVAKGRKVIRWRRTS